MLRHHKVHCYIIAKTVEKVYSYILNIGIFFSRSVEYNILKNRLVEGTIFCAATGKKGGNSGEKQAGWGTKLPVDRERGILYNNHYAVYTMA